MVIVLGNVEEVSARVTRRDNAAIGLILERKRNEGPEDQCQRKTSDDPKRPVNDLFDSAFHLRKTLPSILTDSARIGSGLSWRSSPLEPQRTRRNAEE